MSQQSLTADFQGLTTLISKPLVAGLIVAGIDRFYFGETNMERTAYFSASVAGGIFLGSAIATSAPDLNLGSLGNGKTMEERIVEIATASASAYSVNKYALKNELNRNNMYERLACIAVAEIGSEMYVDFMNGVDFKLL